MVKRRIPRAKNAVLISISQPPFANIYSIERLIYKATAKTKNFNVLKGCVVKVKFSRSCWCLSWSPAKGGVQKIMSAYIRFCGHFASF